MASSRRSLPRSLAHQPRSIFRPSLPPSLPPSQGQTAPRANNSRSLARSLRSSAVPPPQRAAAFFPSCALVRLSVCESARPTVHLSSARPHSAVPLVRSEWKPGTSRGTRIERCCHRRWSRCVAFLTINVVLLVFLDSGIFSVAECH